MEDEGRGVSRVLFVMVISLGTARRHRSRRRLRDCSRPPASASHRLYRLIRRLLQGGLPFSLHAPKVVVLVSVALVRPGCPVGTPIWTVRPGACPGPAPAYARHPAVRSSDFPLPLAGQRPSYSHRRVLAPHAPSYYTESSSLCQGGASLPQARPAGSSCTG